MPLKNTLTSLLLFFLTPHLPLTTAYTPLSPSSLHLLSATLPPTSKAFSINPNPSSLLAPLLIPRVPGTPGSTAAQRHFIDFFTTNLPEWTIEWHNSTSITPATGDTQIPFRNLIFRRDPPWAKEGDVARLTLVAHYDSLYQPEGFIGAVDSAVACAVLMEVARAVDGGLKGKWEGMAERGEGDGLGEEEVGVQIVLLDGEEAWVKWTEEDSLYGSRALAEAWAESPREGMAGTFSNKLESISLFVLLDLLGAPSPKIPSYFAKTHWAYAHMAKGERRLRQLGLLESKEEAAPFLPDEKKQSYQFTMGYVLDDHVPFMERGVDILHLIPTPFPAVWHTMDDDGAHLDLPTVRDWAKIVTVFVAEWMELEGFLASPAPTEKSEKDEL